MKVDISPVDSYLVLERNIELRNAPQELSAQLSQSGVTVLIIGPKPLLDEIRVQPELIAVYIDLLDLEPGTYTLPLIIQSLPEIQVMVFPEEIQVMLE